MLPGQGQVTHSTGIPGIDSKLLVWCGVYQVQYSSTVSIGFSGFFFWVFPSLSFRDQIMASQGGARTITPKPKLPRSKKRPGKSPRIKKMVVGNIILPVDPVQVPPPFVPKRQRGSLLGGAPLFLPHTKQKGKRKKTRRPKSSSSSSSAQRRGVCTTAPSSSSSSPTKQATSLSVIPSTPAILFGGSRFVDPANVEPRRPVSNNQLQEDSTPTVTPAPAPAPAPAPTPTPTPAEVINSNDGIYLDDDDHSIEEGVDLEEQLEGLELEGGGGKKDEIGIPYGSPRLFHDYRNKEKAREVTAQFKFEQDANLREAQMLGSTVFFHSTGLQAAAMTNFSEEANQRSERRIKYLQRLEEKMIKAVETDYSRMKRRVDILQDQRDVRRALEKAYEIEDQWISDLRLKRKYDRKVHQNALEGDSEARAERASQEAERQRQTNAYIHHVKHLAIKKNRESRNGILKQRDEGTQRALEYKRKKLEIIRMEKEKNMKKNRVKTVRRQRAIERNLKTHEDMTDRIQRLLEYRKMYNSEMKRVYDDLSGDVESLRMKQRARNVFAAGESPMRGVKKVELT